MSTASGCVAYNTDGNSESLYEDLSTDKLKKLEDNADGISESLYDMVPSDKPSMLEDNTNDNSENLYENTSRDQLTELKEDYIYEEIPVSKCDIFHGNAAERNGDDGGAKFNP